MDKLRIQINNFISQEECTNFINLGEEKGFEVAGIRTATGEVSRLDIRNNGRVIIEDKSLAADFYNKVKDHLPKNVIKGDELWEIKELNEQLKIYKYDVGQEFKLHRDAPFVRDENNRSFYTLLIYLNEEYEGGETFFLDETIKGETGDCLIFWQNQSHAGLKVKEGVKYAIRTDVMYTKVNTSIEVQAPNEVSVNDESMFTKVFLAGSIEMGKAKLWQPELINKLSNEKIIFFNPRRDDWDVTWKQTLENPKFNEQVTWELTKLEESDIIVMCFDPNTISPVTLIEFGIHVKSGKLIVLCPEGYFRKGNIDITSQFYGVKLVPSMEELVLELKKRLK